ncbi:MAG: DUF421 domain-containing protein [Christensenellales bacterium]|uniref:DUF421 domain-containing protein n=1 Tax=Candidatus Avichristensenella intestinipullorum TaxID=2840693 RepID=A0A9D0YX58_9FIRM|nr:DUF421 domain-containing protein [Christensenellales bacterium]HIQ63582.1 DUF421 domain-containing protein [Candidatus Avichristensenella intestinipullorum]
MLMVLLRAAILFLTAVLVIRMMDKRQVSQLQPFELVIAIMIAELAATPMEDVGTPLLYGVAPMLTLLVLHSALSLLSLKSQRLRAFISGKPSILVKQGVVQEKELRRICYDLNDLLEELRAGGILNPAEVGTAILETSGKMSVFPRAQSRPVTPEDMQLPAAYEGIPLTLVLDGEVQHHNLRIGGLDEAWLQAKLSEFGFSGPGDVLLASLDTRGVLLAQGKGSQPRLRVAQALAPEKVGW